MDPIPLAPAVTARSCHCGLVAHEPRLVVVTGGPGAGKTALLEVVRRHFCSNVVVSPEAASIVFGGGFPRRDSDPGRRAAQRAIFAVQRQLERLAVEDGHASVVLCDRGTVDSVAYWPGSAESFWRDVGSTEEAELARYAAVVHMRTPVPAGEYNHVNPVRIESAAEAHALDERIAAAWARHPRRHFVDEAPDFMEKVRRALALITDEIPACCRIDAPSGEPVRTEEETPENTTQRAARAC